MQTEILKTLQKFGLQENEIKIYLSSLQLEDASPYELAKLTGIPRTTVYDVVMNLALKGLVELNTNDALSKQQTRIKARNPSVLRQLIRKQHQDLNNLEVDLVQVLPTLTDKFHAPKHNVNFQFYPGTKGAKYVAEQEISIDVELPRISFDKLTPMDAIGSKATNKGVDLETRARLHTQKLIKEIVPLNDWSKHVLTYQYMRNHDYLKARNYRLIDNPIFELFTRITVIGERVLIISGDGDEVWGMIIKSKALSKSISAIFHLTWIQAEPLTKELIESWLPNKYFLAEKARKKG